MTTSDDVVAGTILLPLSSTPRETGGEPGLRITGNSKQDEREVNQREIPRDFFHISNTLTYCRHLQQSANSMIIFIDIIIIGERQTVIVRQHTLYQKLYL